MVAEQEQTCGVCGQYMGLHGWILASTNPHAKLRALHAHDLTRRCMQAWRVAVVLLALICGMVVPAKAQGPRQFWILNNTGRTITGFFIREHKLNRSMFDLEDWSPDVLGPTQLPNYLGEIIFLFTNPLLKSSTISCNLDFKLAYSDGNIAVYDKGRDVCRNNVVLFEASGNYVTSVGEH
jgi:hypothetical protein